MSFTPFKEISINNPGTSILYGGNDTKQIMELLNGKVVTGKRPSILNTWIWLDHFDIKAPGTAPVAPTDSNTNRIYTDPTDFKVKIKKTGGATVDIENSNIPDSGLAQITNKAKLPSTVMYEDENNNLGDHYLDVGDIAAPANPASGIRRLFMNSATGELSVRTSAGTTVSLESIAANTDLNALSDVVISAPASAHVVIHNGTNFVNRLLLKADLPNVTMYTDVDNNLGDHYMNFGDIAAPANPAAGNARIFLDTATGKLSVRKSSGVTQSLEEAGGGTGDVQLNAANTYGDFDSIFRSSRVKIRNPANTFSYSLVGSAITAARNLTLPLVTADDTFGVLGLAQTFTAAKTFNNSLLKLRNPADTFSYTVVPSAITADRNITLPLLTGNDTVMTEAHAATATNKTLDVDQNTIKHSTTNAAGDLLVGNGTSMQRRARGTALQVIRTNSGGTDIEWASLDSERVGKSTASGNGSTTVFNIAHGLGSNPTYAFISVQQSGSAFIGTQYTTNSTNIVVTFASAPASGSNNVIIHWRVVA